MTIEAVVAVSSTNAAVSVKNGTRIGFRSIHHRLVTLRLSTMEAKHTERLLVEAGILITATRLRIARSMTLLAQVTLDGVRPRYAEMPAQTRVRSSSLPPSSPPA
jgi:hypothetical protein